MTPPADQSTERTNAEYWNTNGGEHWVAFADRYDVILRPFGAAVIEAAEIEPGQRVLDIGCGNGGTTLEIARLVGPDGVVDGVDVSGPMLVHARERARSEGVANVEFVQTDAQTHKFAEGRYDRAVSRFGVMFFDDPVAAFDNIRGSLRAGGTLTFVCWQQALSNEWLMVPGAALVPFTGMPDLGEPGASGPFAFADAGRVREVLGQAGFDEVVVDPLVRAQRFGDDAEDTLNFLLQTDIAREIIAKAPPEQVEPGMAAVREALTPYETPEGLFLEGSAWLVRATRP